MKVGLRFKMLAPTLAVVIVCMGLASVFSARKGAEELYGELINSSRLIGNNLTKSLGMFVANTQGAVVMQAKNDRIRALLAERNDETLRQAAAALADLAAFDESIQGANLLDTTGEVVASSDPSSKGNFADRDYFKLAMTGKVNVSNPVISRITNKPVFLVAAPVTVEGRIAGVLYVRVDIGKFSESMIETVKVGQNGYAFMTTGGGMIFSHPDKELVLKQDISGLDWGRKMLGQDAGVLEFEFGGRKVTGVYEKEKLTGWMAVLTVSDDDIATAAGAIRNFSLTFSGLGILLVSGCIVLVLGQMLKALRQCVSFSETVASGGLESSLEVRRNDELGVLADSLRAMVASLREMIGTAEQKSREAERQTALAQTAMQEAEEARRQAERAKAEGMMQAADKLRGVVEIVTSASEELSAQIAESSRGAANQSSRMDETATAMEEMNATVLEVARNASSAASTTDEARSKAQDGSGIVGRVVESIGKVQRQAEGLKADMSTLGQQAQDIGRIMNVITDIADQTNLLALNAAIEAARAGDAGRGFAVVADEVRKLAEKTMQATKEVGDAIQGIQHGTMLNVNNVDQATATIHEATGLAQESGGVLKDVVGMIESASDQVRSIATAAEEQASASEEINRSIESVSTISAETSQAMGQAAEAVAELARQTNELKMLMEELEREGRGG